MLFKPNTNDLTFEEFAISSNVSINRWKDLLTIIAIAESVSKYAMYNPSQNEFLEILLDELIHDLPPKLILKELSNISQSIDVCVLCLEDVLKGQEHARLSNRHLFHSECISHYLVHWNANHSPKAKYWYCKDGRYIMIYHIALSTL